MKSKPYINLKCWRIRLLALGYLVTFPISVTVAIVYTHRNLYGQVWSEIIEVFKNDS
jgi:hypothetical protein